MIFPIISVRKIRKICPVIVRKRDKVIFSLGVEVGEIDIDNLALCNFDGLSRVVVVWIQLWIIGRIQHSSNLPALLVPDNSPLELPTFIRVAVISVEPNFDHVGVAFKFIILVIAKFAKFSKLCAILISD